MELITYLWVQELVQKSILSLFSMHSRLRKWTRSPFRSSSPLLTPEEEWIWSGKLDSGHLVPRSAPLGSLCVLAICLADFIFCSTCQDAGKLMTAEHLYCATGKQAVQSWLAPYHTLEFNLSTITNNVLALLWLLHLHFIVFWLLERRVTQNINKIVSKTNV